MSIERINDAIEVMDGVVEAARAMTETLEQTAVATQALGDRLERYADYSDMDSVDDLMHETIISDVAAQVAQEVDQEVIRTLRPELFRPTIDHITAESIVNVQPMTEPWFAPRLQENTDRIADIRLPDEPLQENADPNAAQPEPILNIRGTGSPIGLTRSVLAEPEPSELPEPPVLSVSGNFFARSVPINWGYLNYGSSPIFEVAKSKIKPKPILNPKMVTRRVLNMSEEGWVVK